MTRIAFLVCHLTGTGHLVRTLALARAVAEAGAEPLVISGGAPLAHLAVDLPLVQLPPVTVRGFDYATLRRQDGTPADDAYLMVRATRIAEALGAFRPDVLVTETFPLGRRRLAAEFEGAIAAARESRPGVRVVASVRDIPEPPKKPARIAEATARILRDYDAVLVHGDPALVPLSASWPLPPEAAARVRHTGYVAVPPPPEPPRDQTVLVAGGGGPAGEGLLTLAAAAARQATRPWHLITGGPEAEGRAAALRAEGLTADPPRADYRALLAGAACSVSLAGYNTAMDLAACRTPAILVPFEEHGEREQAIRAAALARFDGVTVLSAAGLAPERLAAEVERAAGGPRRPPLPIARAGAARAAAALLAAVPA